MKKLRVFRIQPDSYERITQLYGESKNRSGPLRTLIAKSCVTPPTDFPVRALKADLKAFSLFMEEDDHKALVKASKKAGVSKNIFIEAVFNRECQLSSMARAA